MSDLLTVCAECNRACCWHGEGLCDLAKFADIREIDRSEFDSLGLEHPDVWHRQKLVNGEINEAEYRRRIAQQNGGES